MTHIDISQSANAARAGAGLEDEGAGPAPGGVTASGGPAQAPPAGEPGPSESAALKAEAEGAAPLVAGHPHEGVGHEGPAPEGPPQDPELHPAGHEPGAGRAAGPGPGESPRTGHDAGEGRRGKGREEPFMSVQGELNRWFEEFWRQASGLGMSPALRPARPLAALSPASMFGLPAVDVKESDVAWRVCAELPGLKAEDIDVEVRGESLVIAGHKSEEKDDHRAAFRISERRFGRFERRFPIPPDVDRERIEATFRDGLLTVTLPRAHAAARTSRIEIRH